MIFSLEALDAGHGDALLLHYGPANDPSLLIIDGGVHGIWEESLRPRLEEIAELRDLQGPVVAKLAMVSHIDQDHITGILDMFKDLQSRVRNRRDLIVDVEGLWHNSFDELLNNNEISAFEQLVNWMDTATGADIAALRVDLHSLMLAGDAKKGRSLRRIAGRLQVRTNRPFNDGFINAGRTVNIGHNTKIITLGPSKSQLRALENDWDDQLASISAASATHRIAMIAAYLDTSVANLSSLVFLVKRGNKEMLLTGDARGDFILDALEKANLISATGSVTFDILKVPHHGSDRNVDDDFFRRIKAHHYVFSGDGTVGSNPDISTLKMVTKARGSTRYTMSFTNKLSKIVSFVRRDRQRNNRNYSVEYRDANYFSVWVDLEDELTY